MILSLGSPMCLELFQTNNSQWTVTWKGICSSSIAYNDVWLVAKKHVIAIFYITSLIPSLPRVSALKTYVCLYLCLHIIYIIYIYTHTYVYIHIYIYIYIYINANNVNIHIHIYIYILDYICRLYIYIYVCIYIHIYNIYLYTYIHIYIFIYIYILIASVYTKNVYHWSFHLFLESITWLFISLYSSKIS